MNRDLRGMEKACSSFLKDCLYRDQAKQRTYTAQGLSMFFVQITHDICIVQTANCSRKVTPQASLCKAKNPVLFHIVFQKYIFSTFGTAGNRGIVHASNNTNTYRICA